MDKINDVKMYTVELPVFFRIKHVFALDEDEAKITAFQRILGKLEVEDKLGMVLICPDQSIVEEEDSDEDKQFLDEMKKEVKEHGSN